MTGITTIKKNIFNRLLYEAMIVRLKLNIQNIKKNSELSSSLQYTRSRINTAYKKIYNYIVVRPAFIECRKYY
jgi:hypothetical protein